MNTSASRNRLYRSNYLPEMELDEKNIKAEGEEMTIVDKKKANSESKKEIVIFFRDIKEWIASRKIH